MTVRELIELLRTMPADLPVAYRCCSEWAMLEAEQMQILELQAPRADGWVHGARPDKTKRPYLTFPGN